MYIVYVSLTYTYTSVGECSVLLPGPYLGRESRKPSLTGTVLEPKSDSKVFISKDSKFSVWNTVKQ